MYRAPPTLGFPFVREITVFFIQESSGVAVQMYVTPFTNCKIKTKNIFSIMRIIMEYTDILIYLWCTAIVYKYEDLKLTRI